MMPTEEQNPPEKQLPAVERRRPKKGTWIVIAAIVALGIGGYIYYSRQPAAKPGAAGSAPGGAKGAPQITPVVAVAARTSDVGVYINGLGSVTPNNSVTVRTRVDGQLMEVRFREGQNVSKGELLALIDPRPFQVQLTQAEGQMARDREQLNNARLDLQRYKLLWQQDSIPKQQYDTQEALVRQLEGAVKSDQGLIDNARLQLVYSRITAPVGGRVGLRLVDAGNIVHAADANGLVVINQLQPSTVVFPIPEDNLPKVQAKLKTGTRLAVDAYDREQKQRLASGTLLTLDNQIDPTTGTVKLKALFPNLNNELFPNQFVNARLLVETLKDAIVVPAAAIQRGSQGTFVYLLKPDRTVTIRPVTVGVVHGEDIVVTGGLQPGERVVVEGAERLREGSKVEVREPGQRGRTQPSGQNQTDGQHRPKP
ncbi:MdtA/MuxA family multidrug efflux RND transporter periplasmic adaptor subunit [Geobacter sp. SVR]|uniref:MdtA/MuxA family multidrug efflux RND transporter periplasmic adaptor subunit n=1 Tax=Geobacter sp. SVR TaxID=2495594 RepID=UPI00143EFD05|nr:MdtA/MuxA family multidrug efflux RND transporter periplasmic adaptor subunit [Geobacter sp. SVR]BCS52026.1 multidrug transporter [Geobacter sp. SVR]GCF87160.1 multidrug transporter [Geobacter sp. SVR]